MKNLTRQELLELKHGETIYLWRGTVAEAEQLTFCSTDPTSSENYLVFVNGYGEVKRVHIGKQDELNIEAYPSYDRAFFAQKRIDIYNSRIDLAQMFLNKTSSH